MEAILIENFTKSYKNVIACKNINLKVPKGCIYGFVGKNGAGKTSLIRCLTNMLMPTSGTIKVLGKDVLNEEAKSLISYLPSEVNFSENIKVKDFLNLAYQFSNQEVNISDLASYFELDLNKRLAELSLGNKKKVLIISCLIKDSEVYVLDEPTNGLDPLMQEKFFKLILALKEKGKTIFLSSHNLREIEKYADLVAIIKEGQIVKEINLKELNLSKHLVKLKLKDNQKESYLFEGDINQLINSLASKDLQDLEISKASLEDEFRGFYEV